MFITSQGFKKLINEAYKGVGLNVGNDGEGYYISGGYWVISIMHGWIPKKRVSLHYRADGRNAGTRRGIQSNKSWQPVRTSMA